MNERHGGAYDRGLADRYYKRDFNPHYFVGDSYNSSKVEVINMTETQIKEYSIGFDDGGDGPLGTLI